MTGRLKSLEWKNNVLYLLDQRKLPQKQEYLACTDYKEAAQAIRTLAVRGAPAIGITAAYAMVLAVLAFTARGLSGESLRHAFYAAGEVLEQARPTAVNLSWAVREMEKTFDVEIITPDRVFYKGTADLLEFNTESGEIGVYRDHIPLTTVLEPGLVTIHHGDEEQVAAVHAGFAEILGDKVTLLAELAEWPEEIDLERAEAARERAEERIHNRNDNLDLKRAEFALHKALIRINLAEYR